MLGAVSGWVVCCPENGTTAGLLAGMALADRMGPGYADCRLQHINPLVACACRNQSCADKRFH